MTKTREEKIEELKERLKNTDPHNGFVIKKILFEILNLL